MKNKIITTIINALEDQGVKIVNSGFILEYDKKDSNKLPKYRVGVKIMINVSLSISPILSISWGWLGVKAAKYANITNIPPT